MPPADVQLAHAKLTVHLHVTGRRDDGYHLIDAEMVSLELHDRLTFTDGDGISLTGPEAAGVPTTGENLVAKALMLAGRIAHVEIDKNIPAGGGLGGGSSDAAAALRWADVTDPARAAQIGADVPFCLRGGRARVEGIGDVVTPLSPVERWYTLLLPPFGVNTGDVYREFATSSESDEGTRNHLQAAALRVEPRLIEWRDKLRNVTESEPVLAGSGSTWFIEGAFPAPPAEILGEARWIVTRTTQPIPLDL